MSFISGFLPTCFVLVCAILIYKLMKKLTRSTKGARNRRHKTMRPLDKLVSTMELLKERDGSANLCLILSLISEQQLLKEHVHDALVLLSKRQPMLRAIITSLSTSFTDNYFEVVNDIDLDFTTSDVKAREWQDMWYDFTSSRHGSDLLWRAVLLKEEYIPVTEIYINTLVFKFSHSCIDGVSLMKFGKQLLHYINGVADGTLTTESNIASFDLLPSFHEVLHQRPWPAWQKYLGLPKIWNVLLKRFVRVLTKFKRKCPIYERFPPSLSSTSDQRTRIIVKVFSEDETLKFVDICRSKRCTVTGALMAAVHIAFCRLLGEDFPLPTRLENLLAINGQRNCKPKPPEDYLGLYALGHTFFMPFVKREVDFWQFSEETTSMIHNALNKELHIKQTVPIINAFSAEELCNELHSSSDPETMMRLSTCNLLSNLGLFDFGSEQHYKYDVHECLITGIIGKLAGTFFHGMTTVNDKLSWIISSSRSRVEEDKAQQFTKLCFNTLNEINEMS